MVHALDFRYFYDADAVTYTDYLWESWATVPSVLADPEHYLLRTISAISTTFAGDLEQKFRQSVELIRERVSILKTRILNNALLIRLEEMLHAGNTRLRLMSLPNQYLAEITVHCLYSSKVNADLTEDRFLDATEDGMNYYSLKMGSFIGEAVQSPISLLVDRIKQLDQSSDEVYCPEQRSAWLFLAVASALGEG